MKRNKLSIAIGLLSSGLLVACNGGGESSKSSVHINPTEPYTVTVIDGYLKNALVWLDINGNYLLDNDEPSAISGNNGNAILNVAGITDPEQYPLVVQAMANQTVDMGSDISAPENNMVKTSYVMSAPAGEKEVTPLSTLVQISLEQEIANHPSKPKADLKQKSINSIAQRLSIAPDDVLGDFIQENDSNVAYAAKNIINANILPTKPDQMSRLIDEVREDDNSPFLARTEAVSNKIRATINSVTKQAEADGNSAEKVSFNTVKNTFTGDETYIDSDEDGVPDYMDDFPNDATEWVNSDAAHPTNSDNVGDNADDDDDGDGVKDVSDMFPFNPAESLDTDGDGIGNNQDTDDDNDGVNDNRDALPLDASESVDTDKDGIGNNKDDDDDNDGVADTNDAFPLKPEESIDTDGDGIGNNQDTDDDNDGINDNRDALPLDATESVDTDKDGIGNNKDDDDDNDGVADINDSFPLDTDNDGISNYQDPDDDNDGVMDTDDAFPLDASESVDTDKDNIGNNKDTDDDNDGVMDTHDAFPLDPTEWKDSDGDNVGDNADAFPNDATEWLDTDGDNVGDNTDAYKDDAAKSVPDVQTSNSYTTPVVSMVYQKPMVLNVTESTKVETFNNGDIHTEKTMVYTTPENVVFGESTESEQLKNDGSFTRIYSWSNDFNLDGESLFNGKLLDIGSRTVNGESYWRYIDENNANVEGVANGVDARTFDNCDFSARKNLNDLTAIDTIQHATVSWTDTADGRTITTDIQQYPVDGFALSAADNLVAEFAMHTKTEIADNKVKSIDDRRDWGADGTTNQSSQFRVLSENSYTFAMQRPVWANPADGIDEEYADFSYNLDKADNLTSYWFETNDRVDKQGIRIYAGKRYVLNQSDGTPVKLVNAENPDGLLFQEFSATSQSVSDTESNEAGSWTHYPLTGYDYTVDSESTGQAYKVFQKQSNGIWIGYTFRELGSQSVGNLAGQVEAARARGTALSDINEHVIPGLSYYNDPITTSSFISDEQGNPRTWYFISNNSIVTDGEYTLSPVTLTDNGFKTGWLVLTASDNFILAQPAVEQPWNWFTAYERHWLGIETINTDTNNFNWTNWLGEFYLDKSAAEARLAELTRN